MNEVTERLLKGMPKLNRKEMQEINALFPSYLFRRRKTREIWTSCCGKYAVLRAGHPLLDLEHMPEERERKYGYHMGTKKRELVACPYCGKKGSVKELGRTGDRKNLWDYWRVVVLRWHRGALWAVGYEARKGYGAHWQLTAAPYMHPCAVYRFTPGKVESCKRYWWGESAWEDGNTVTTTRMKPDFKVYEPFGYCSEFGTGYRKIGLEEVKKSPFRWCRTEEYLKEGSELIRFLAVCTAYPRQVELLMKAGMVNVVQDFAERKKSNAAAFNWYADTVFEGLGLTKQELKEFMATTRSAVVLAKYKQLRRKGIPVRLKELDALKSWIGEGEMFERVAARIKKYRIGVERLIHYFEKQRKQEENVWYAGIVGWWCDYLDAAEYLGYDLKNEVFLLPKDLKRKHDEATGTMAGIIAAKKKDELRKAEKERCRALAKRYTYTDGTYLIRPPVGADEIIKEGESLKHCVGGYAQRHVEGQRTILFLRARERPGRSLVTIEMDGNKIVQIHGWDDERTACNDNPKRENPREIYREFLDTWLAWLAKGSRRDKTGQPILPEKRSAKTA